LKAIVNWKGNSHAAGLGRETNAAAAAAPATSTCRRPGPEPSSSASGLQAAATGVTTAQCRRLRSDGDPGRRAAATGAEEDARRGSGRETAVAMGGVDEDDDGRTGCGGSEREKACGAE